MRYVKHSLLLKFLLQECKLSEEEFDRAIENACPITTEDIVLIHVGVDNKKWQYTILHDENWTAMQKATAFPAAAVASLIADGEFADKKVPEYRDVPFNKMVEKLNAIGDFPDLSTGD
jgi:hypothetical protein